MMPPIAMPAQWSALGALPPAAEPAPPTAPILHTVTVVRKKSAKQAKVENVPPEEFGISKRARNLDPTTYCFHRVRRTEQDLIAQGYDASLVKTLSTSGHWAPEETARDTVEQGSSAEGDAGASSTRPIDIVEHYCFCDYDEDGSPSLYRVTTASGTGQVLTRDGKPDIEEVDDNPFASATPVIMPHRFFGKSIADLVMDIQRIKTALTRQLLDNAYFANNQRVEVAEAGAGDRTIDDLLVNRPGGFVRVKVSGTVTPIPNQEIGSFAFPLLEYIDQAREFRTGVSRMGQGLDPNTLQNQSATASNQIFTATQAKERLIARIIAETGIKDLFSKLHAVIRKHDREQNTIRLRNKWVTVDPRDWKERNDLTINVGLGTGSKRERLQNLMIVLGMQKEAILQPALGLVKPKNLFNTAEKIIELIDLKTVEPYFEDPEAVDPQTGQPKPPPPTPPDPKMAEVQGKLQMQQQQMQADQQAAQAKMQADQQIAVTKGQSDYQLEMAKLSAQTQADAAKTQSEAALKREQLAAEMALKREQLQAELNLKREQLVAELQLQRELGHAGIQAKAKVSSDVHPGGAPG